MYFFIQLRSLRGKELMLLYSLDQELDMTSQISLDG